MSTKQVEKDSFIFQEGDVADVAYFVESGKIALLQSGTAQTSAFKTLSENEVFGEHAVFDANSLRPYSAKALEASSVVAITPEELQKLLAQAPKPLNALLTLATERMKQGRIKSVRPQDMAVSSTIKKITVAPIGDKMKAQMKPLEVPVTRLPFRIGGFPEGGEANRRDIVHLFFAATGNPLRVSRQHCEIGFEDNVLSITDLGSRFNTTVNGTTIGRGRGKYIAPLTLGENTVTLGTADGNYTLSVMCE